MSASDIAITIKNKFEEGLHSMLDCEKEIKRRRSIAFLLSTILVILSFFYDPIIFVEQGGAEKVPYYHLWIWFTKLLLFFLLMWFWNYVLSKKISDLKYTIIYLVPILALFLLIYPGVWRWDELIILQNVTYGNIYYWQHWLSSIYYYLCLCLIPIPAGIVIVQSILASFIVGYVISRTYEYLGKWALLLYIPLFMPFVLDTIYYPMRASICGFLELFLVFEMLITALKHEEITKGKLIGMIIISALISAWRPENILWILVFTIFLLFVYKYSFKTTCKYMTIGIVLLLSSMTIQSSGLSNSYMDFPDNNHLPESELYTLTGFIEPFGELIKIASERGDFSKELATVDECISVKMICDHNGIYAFWNGGMKSLTKEQLSSLEQIYVKLIIAYLPDFFNERWETFIEANGINSAETMLKTSAHMYDDPESLPEELRGPYTEFIEDFYCNKPANKELRKEIISALEMKYETDYYSSTTGKAPLMYNCLPSFICVLILGAIAMLFHKWVYAVIILGIILKGAVVFLAAPMSLYMYYFSTQLICSIMVMFCIAALLDTKINKTHASN